MAVRKGQKLTKKQFEILRLCIELNRKYDYLSVFLITKEYCCRKRKEEYYRLVKPRIARIVKFLAGKGYLRKVNFFGYNFYQVNSEIIEEVCKKVVEKNR